jgi:hypothetical protein
MVSGKYANDFFEIPSTLASNKDLRDAVIHLIDAASMPGKVLEGGNRIDLFRTILVNLALDKISLTEAYQRTMRESPRSSSPYSASNRVFSRGWAERQVRTQFSRFYNQAVLEQLRAAGIEMCFVPHSSTEKPDSSCTRLLAGREHSVDMLYERLIDAYEKGNWSSEVKIPDHPHCTHVVKPMGS